MKGLNDFDLWNKGQTQHKVENLPSRDDKKACSIVKFFINQYVHNVRILIRNYCGQECVYFLYATNKLFLFEI